MTVHSVESLFNPDKEEDNQLKVYLHSEVQQFLRDVREMRTHQKNYFETRAKRDLKLAIGAERRLDESIENLLS